MDDLAGSGVTFSRPPLWCIIVAPAGTKTAAAAIRALLDNPAKPRVRAVYRDLSKVPAEFTANGTNFEAVQGDVADAASLDFAGANAVLTITPPVHDCLDIVEHAKMVSQNVKDAIEKADTVHRLVLLSSSGAQFERGVGEIKTNNMAETVLAHTKVQNVVFVRAAYFMENWAATLESLKGPEPFVVSTISPDDWSVPMVAVKDVGSALATELLKWPGMSMTPHVFELHGPRRYTPRDVQDTFSQASGRGVGLQIVAKDELHDFFSRVLPAQIVPEWVEMASSFLPGGILAPTAAAQDDCVLRMGNTDLLEVIKELVDPGLTT